MVIQESGEDERVGRYYDWGKDGTEEGGMNRNCINFMNAKTIKT